MMHALSALLLALPLVTSGGTPPATTPRVSGGAPPAITVLSNGPHLLSGGDALVELDRPARVTLNGRDVSASFATRPNGRVQGLVTGLRAGRNTLVAGGRRLTLTNHPSSGPIFAGPQVTPWFCLPGGCEPPVTAELLYRDAAGAFLPYDPAAPPSGLTTTTTDDGRTVPFVVRRETGAADRGVYQIAVLVDPAQPVEPWSIAQPWSHKVLYTYGGGCGVEHRQTTPGSVLQQAAALGRGFAVATSSLNTFQNNCNDVVSAEATMMVKEIITERHGPIRYTIGTGASAGSMQQHLITQNYPGLLDGILTGLTYEDHWTQVQHSLDCVTLDRYFKQVSPALWPTADARLPVWGSSPGNPDNQCGQKLALGLPTTEYVADSPEGCGPPGDWIYHAVTNPRGERCTIQDYNRAVFGVDRTGKAPRPVDNAGVPYGLAGLTAGTITPEQFADLNAKVGGLDIDGHWQPARTTGDPGALRTLYRTGRVTTGQGAANVPEIDVRANPQDTGFHPPFQSWSWRARIDRANGDHDGNVIWLSGFGAATPDPLTVMDAWLAAVTSDRSSAPLRAKIARHRPAEATDGCFLPTGKTDLTCGGTWRYHGNPRLAAGAPFTNDIQKCRLKPLRARDFPVSFTPAQWTLLRQAFPAGICDWTEPGIGQEPLKGTWLDFG
ncbi:DUF6351 family protein [Nonomuraea sp. NPDC002799]